MKDKMATTNMIIVAKTENHDPIKFLRSKFLSEVINKNNIEMEK